MHIVNDSHKNDVNNIYKIEQNKLLQVLKQGSIFKGEVVNITNNTISLKLSNGAFLDAKMMQSIDLKIGSIIDFEVKSNSDSKLIIKPHINENTSKSNMILDALQEAKVTMTDENINLVNMLVKNKMPINTNSINKVMIELNTNDNLSVELLDYMFQNDIKLDTKIITHLSGYNQNKIEIASQIDSLINQLVNNIDNKSIQEAIESIFENKFDISDIIDKKQAPVDLKNKLINKFSITPSSEDNIKDLSKLYKTILKDVSTLETMLSAKDNKDIIKEISNIKDNIDFMQTINEKICLLQIPLQFSKGLVTGNLYVIDDENNPNGDMKNKMKTAILSLDLYKLGHFESFLLLDNNMLSCNINVESEKIKTLINNNINLLRKGLNTKGIILKDINITVTSSTFNFINLKNAQNSNDNEDKRYSFDMRV